jgi:hypothetical protein
MKMYRSVFIAAAISLVLGGTLVFSDSGSSILTAVGLNNAVAPNRSNQIGVQDLGGNLQAASPSNPVPTDIKKIGGSLLSLGQGIQSQSVPVVPPSDYSTGHSAVVSLTRTADTNAYLANDIVGAATGSTAALTFASLGVAGQEVKITSIALEIDATAVISGETSYRLYLYSVTPPSALGDNAAWDLPSGDRASYLGYIDLGTPVDLGSTLYVQTDSVNRQIKLTGTGLFGYLVTSGPYTPTSARVYVVTLHTTILQ